MIERIRNHPLARYAGVLAALMLLSLITGFSQVKTEGLAWQEENYLPQLQAIMSAEASPPALYRRLSCYVVLWSCGFAEATGLPRPVGVTFVALRLLQNFALFLLAYCFYRKLDIPAFASLLGLSALAWGMTQCNYGADLGFDFYAEVVFYLLAALLLLHQRYSWLAPLAALAAMNRETSILLPAMIAIWTLPRFGVTSQPKYLRRSAVISLALFFAVHAVLRLNLGTGAWIFAYDGVAVGLPMLLHNFSNDVAWGHAAGTLGIVPILAFAGYGHWQPALRPLFWAVVPLWLAACLVFVPLEQSRVLLLPQVLVFIPGMLCGLVAMTGSSSPREDIA